MVINDNTQPVCLTQDITVQIDGSGTATITASQIDNGSNDNCGVASISVSQTVFTSTDIGDNTVTFTVTDVNGNPSNCDAIVTVEAQTLDVENNDIQVLSVAPNPFNDNILISIPPKYSNDTFNITIYDLNGRKVFNRLEEVYNNIIRLNGLNRLQKAPYILRIVNTRDNGSTTKRLLKY